MSSVGSHREAVQAYAKALQPLISVAIQPDKLTNQILSDNLSVHIIRGYV